MFCALIVENSLLIREGLRSLLEQRYRGNIVLGQPRPGEKVLAAIDKRQWDLIVVGVNDLSGRGGAGFILLGEICKHAPSANVLVLDANADEQRARLSREVGATGYCSIHARSEELVAALRDVFAGQKHFPVSPGPQSKGTPGLQMKPLSTQEQRVMLALAQGKRPSEIAAELGLNIKTVSTYKRRVLSKLELRSTADLVRHVLQNNLR